MVKEMFKTKFRAIMNVNGKEFTLAKSGNTEQSLIKIVKEAGMKLSQIVKIEPFQVLVEKTRGKSPRKF